MERGTGGEDDIVDRETGGEVDSAARPTTHSSGDSLTPAILWLRACTPNPRDSRPPLNGESVVIDERKARQLLGETIRDIGILVVVFGPLDAFFQEGRVSTLPLVLIVAAGLLCIALGIMIEAKE